MSPFSSVTFDSGLGVVVVFTQLLLVHHPFVQPMVLYKTCQFKSVLKKKQPETGRKQIDLVTGLCTSLLRLLALVYFS